MTLDNKEKTIGSILASVIKENYKGVNEVDNDTGYVEEEITKIFEKIKSENMDLKDEDKYNSCFITNQNMIFPYADLVGKRDADAKDYYTYIINLAVHCLMRDTACNIISLSSILNLKKLCRIVATLYKSTSFTTISKKKGFTKLYINTIDFNIDNTITDINLVYNNLVEHNLIPFDAILALDDYGVKNSNIVDEIINSSMNWSSINLYQNILLFLKELKAFTEKHEIIITLFGMSGKSLSNFINAKKEGIEEWLAYPGEIFCGGYIPAEKYPLSTEELHSKEQLDKEEHKKLDIKFQELYNTYDYIMRDLFHKVGKQYEAKKEGTINANEMTSILSCNPPNSLAYSFNNPPKYSTIVFSPDYKISEILEVKDIEKQAEAEYLENKNIICVYDDKKEKRNSYEAILNIDIGNDSSKSNGHGRLDFHIAGYGVDKEEAVNDLNLIYVDIMNKFHGLKK